MKQNYGQAIMKGRKQSLHFYNSYFLTIALLNNFPILDLLSSNIIQTKIELTT